MFPYQLEGTVPAGQDLLLLAGRDGITGGRLRAVSPGLSMIQAGHWEMEEHRNQRMGWRERQPEVREGTQYCQLCPHRWAHKPLLARWPLEVAITSIQGVNRDLCEGQFEVMKSQILSLLFVVGDSGQAEGQDGRMTHKGWGFSCNRKFPARQSSTNLTKIFLYCSFLIKETVT